MPRLLGSRSLTRWLPISSSPSVMVSSPAIIRKRVDLPQPEGPTKTTNSLSAISRSTPLMTSTEPNDLRTALSFNPLMASPSLRVQVNGGLAERRARDRDLDRAARAAGLQPEPCGAAAQRRERRPDERRRTAD